jgi:hypothetical protein
VGIIEGFEAHCWQWRKVRERERERERKRKEGVGHCECHWTGSLSQSPSDNQPTNKLFFL